MRQGAQGWCTGMTLGDGMGRKVGGGFWMENTCAPVAIHVNVWQKPLQYCKVISLQLKKKKIPNWFLVTCRFFKYVDKKICVSGYLLSSIQGCEMESVKTRM